MCPQWQNEVWMLSLPTNGTRTENFEKSMAHTWEDIHTDCVMIKNITYEVGGTLI